MTNPAVESHSDPVATLRDPATIRERAHRVLMLGLEKKLEHFSIDLSNLDVAAGIVADVIRENYPDLDIPYHSRWRHFSVGGVDRWAALREELQKDDGLDDEEVARCAIDLAVVSVLLDAGAGAGWSFTEEETGGVYTRSEGLAVASFHMFTDGLFSDSDDMPCRVEAPALENLSEEKLAEGFQLSGDNEMAGFEGRVGLVRALARAMRLNPEMFGTDAPRPGRILDFVTGGQDVKQVPATDILQAVLTGFASIWPGRTEVNGENLGDVWTHSLLRYPDDTDRLMPFHKLSQWLTYSLLEPFEWAGVAVTGLDELTGLAEYRNGGLFVDTGVISLNDRDARKRAHSPDSELIVEWRALTLALLDELRVPVASRLGLKPEEFPLARMLEGGSWAAGRRLAFARDDSGDPPIRIVSDGTVF